MKVALCVLVLSFIAVDCYEMDRGMTTPPPPREAPAPLPPKCFACNCPRNMELECGNDGLTYNNHCMMECAKVNCPELTANLDPTRSHRGACN